MIKKKISVVLASYNEAKNIPIMHERLTKSLSKITTNYEIIFVDNGSKDNSEEILRDIVKRDSHVIDLKLSRNFNAAPGAFTAGMDYATGDCVINMDGDGEDPPEAIEGLVKKWLEGYDIVYGVRRRRRVNFARNAGYKLFYRLFKKIAYIDVPLDAGEFALMDRKVVDIINRMPEKDRFIRGLRAWVGFKSIGVLYDREARIHGKTTNSMLDNVRWAVKAIFAFSYFPLELISYLSFITFCVSLIAILFYFVSYFFIANPPKGISTIIILVLFLGSIQLLALAIIGGYIAKIFQEVKNRPKYIVDEVIRRKV